MLSKVFRKQKGVYRSCFPKIPMATYGEYAKKITEKHIDSSYQFDNKSPYGIATFTYNAKILLLGMGKNFTKYLFFVVLRIIPRKIIHFIQIVIFKQYAVVKGNGEEKRIRYFDRKETYSNNKKVFESSTSVDKI